MVRVCLAISALLSTVLAATVVNDGVLHVDISDHSSLTKQSRLTPVEEFLVNVNATLAKYNANYRISPLPDLSKRIVAHEPVHFGTHTSVFQAAYYGNIGINSQTFTVGLDTGSANLWVPAKGCSGCPSKHAYNERGMPLHKSIYVKYGSGDINGTEWTDTVSLAGLSAKHTALTAVHTAKGFKDAPSAGLLGMAPGSHSVGHYPTVIDNLIAAKKLSKPEFSFFLGRNATKSAQKGKLTLGGADQDLYSGSFTKVPVIGKGFWVVKVDAAYLNGTSLGKRGAGQAVVDTGTRFLYTPPAVVSALAHKIPGGKVIVPKTNNGGFLAFPCNQNFTVAIGFGGKQFAINKLDLVMEREHKSVQKLIELVGAPKDHDIEASSEEYCLANVAGVVLPGSGHDFYIIGDTFLKNWYSTFNYVGKGSISFAKAKFN